MSLEFKRGVWAKAFYLRVVCVMERMAKSWGGGLKSFKCTRNDKGAGPRTNPGEQLLSLRSSRNSAWTERARANWGVGRPWRRRVGHILAGKAWETAVEKKGEKTERESLGLSVKMSLRPLSKVSAELRSGSLITESRMVGGEAGS